MHQSKYFCGNKISDYGLKHCRVDYATLAKAFDAVLSNDIITKTWGVLGEWERENGPDYSDEIAELEEEIEELRNELDDLEDDFDCPERKYYEATLQEKEERLEDCQRWQDDEPEIFQYYIISHCGADILKRYTDEYVYYNYELNIYVWGVTHWGTSWAYVLTDIAIDPSVCKEDEADACV